MSEKNTISPKMHNMIALATSVDLTTISKVALLIEKRKIEIDAIVKMCKDVHVPLDQEAIKRELEHYNAKLFKLLVCTREEDSLESEDKMAIIQDALYATGKFSTEDCNVMAEGILQYISDANLEIMR